MLSNCLLGTVLTKSQIAVVFCPKFQHPIVETGAHNGLDLGEDICQLRIARVEIASFIQGSSPC